MTRSRRFQPLQQHSDARVREAALALARAQEELRVHTERLRQLTDYRDEYGRDFRLHGDAAQSHGWLRNYQIFLAQLNAGIAQQEAVIAEHRRRVAAARAAWEQARTRARALDNAVDSMRREEHRNAERREQRMLDDRARRDPE